MHSYLVNDNSEHKKPKGVNRYVVATISHNKYKDVLLHKKCLRHLMNRIQTKDHKIKTYEMNKISLMIKYTFKIMDMNDWLLVITVNYKKQLS